MSYQTVSDIIAERDQLRAELAASQAREAKRLRELEWVDAYSDFAELYSAVREARSIPNDDTALKTCLKEERERCARRCEDFAEGDGRWCAAAIRALGDE